MAASCTVLREIVLFITIILPRDVHSHRFFFLAFTLPLCLPSVQHDCTFFRCFCSCCLWPVPGAVGCPCRLQKRLGSSGNADFEEIESLKVKIEQLEVELTKCDNFPQKKVLGLSKKALSFGHGFLIWVWLIAHSLLGPSFGIIAPAIIASISQCLRLYGEGCMFHPCHYVHNSYLLLLVVVFLAGCSIIQPYHHKFKSVKLYPKVGNKCTSNWTPPVCDTKAWE